MGKIIPGWEWRTFSENLTESENLIKETGLKIERESSEIYILSTNSNDNTKIREELMDIKTPIRIKDGLEQWTVLTKASFPIHINDLALVFKAFNVELPLLEKDELNYEEYIQLINNTKELTMVNVYKHRYGYMVDDAIVEIATGKFDDYTYKTIAVEHTDPKLVMNTVKKLKLDKFDNVNYIKAMKDSVWR
jgi:exopolyphosphatase/guanosine-5'-triphosphate,3'-diphosphate pyrophosphatase